MARTLNTAGSGFLLPPGVLEALRRRLIEAGGLGLFLLAAALLAALLSYAPGDPSFNSVTDSAAHNLLGRPGAYAADVLLQTFGIVGGLPALVLAFWGWKLLRKRDVSSPWLRLGMLGAAMIQLGMGVSAIAVPDAWPLLAGFGGIVGGVVTPTEAGVLAVLYGLLLGLVVYRELRLQDLPYLLAKSAKQTAVIMMIIASAKAFGWLLTHMGAPEMMASGFASISERPWVFLLILNVAPAAFQAEQIVIPWRVAAIIAPVVIVGGQIGALINNRLKGPAIVWALIVAYMLVGFLVLGRTLLR